MEQVLSWVQWGVPITLWSQPPTIGHQRAFSDAQLQWLANKLPCLVHMGLVLDLGNGPMQPNSIDVISLVHLVPKKGLKQWQLVHNLCGIHW
jgi:hypothetical protein